MSFASLGRNLPAEVAAGDVTLDADEVLIAASAMTPLFVTDVWFAEETTDEALDPSVEAEDASGEWASGLIAGGLIADDGLGVVIVADDVGALYVVAT